MQNSDADDLPLTGADCFLRAFEAEVGRTAGASHLSQLVLRLGEGFDASAFRALVEEIALVNPIMRSPVARRGVAGAPVYRLSRATPGSVRFEIHAPGAPSDSRDANAAFAPALGPFPEIFHRRLNERFDARRGRLVAFDVVPRGGPHPGTDVAMTWVHMLFDGAGSEAFVEHLAACSADASHPRVIDVTRAESGASSPAAAELPRASGERGRMAQAWQRYMQGMATRPPRSPAGPLGRVRQDLRYDEMRLEGESAAATISRAKKTAGFLTPMLFYLAVAMRAHQAVAERRGAVPASWIVPLPVNMRPKGSAHEVFRTHVSLLWFQVTPEETASLESLVETLKAQRLEAIRTKLVEAGVAAMDFARHAPSRLYTHMARRTFGGELASFFFAYTADFAPAAATLCGAPILDGLHVPGVPPSPGSALVFSLRGGGLDVVHVRQNGVFGDGELAVLREQILRDLGAR